MADADSTAKPKGQALVEEFIALKDTNPTKAEAKRKQLQDEFDEEEVNRIVKNTPGKTNKERKELKALLRSNDPIELPALPPPVPGKSSPPITPRKDDDGGLKSAASNRLREKSCLEFLLCEKFSPVFFRTDANSGRK